MVWIYREVPLSYQYTLHRYAVQNKVKSPLHTGGAIQWPRMT